jgi:hypothetical protein
MSAGHHHRSFNKLSHARELRRLLTTGGAPALMRRWDKLDLEHDIAYLCGYNVQGTTRFADRDFVHCLYDPAHAEQILGAAIDTGLSPDDTLECCLWHEGVEKVLLDADNPINDYEDAHEFASAGEDEKVRQKGGTPLRYNRGLERIIKFCQVKPIKTPPHDLDCAPYLDDQDHEDLSIIKVLKGLHVPDAFKASKASVDYGLSRSAAHHCSICRSWQGAQSLQLSPCAKVEGLVRNDRGCKLFEPMRAAAPHLDMNAHARWRSEGLQRPVQHPTRAAAGGAVPAMGAAAIPAARP